MSNIIDKIQLSGVTYTLSGTSSGGTNAVEVTQAEYDALVSGGTVDPTVFYIITDATPIDVSTFVTSGQMTSAITQATSGKVNTSSVVSSVTSGSTDSEIPTAKAVYDAIPTGGTGGGVDVVQTTGTSTTDVMSQNAVTSSLDNLSKIHRDSDEGIIRWYTVLKHNGTYDFPIYNFSINGRLPLSKQTRNSDYSNIFNFHLVDTSAITSSVTSASTDNEIPSAKAVFDAIPTGGTSVTIDPTLDSGSTNPVANSAITEALDSKVNISTQQNITGNKTFIGSSDTKKKPIILKQAYDSHKIGFVCQNSASTNNELATFEFRPDTYTDSSSVKHPLLYLGHYRNKNTANAGVVQTMIGFRQYDQANSAAYHYLMPLPNEAKTPFSLTTTFKNYFAPLGFKNGSTMITTDNTGVADFSSVLGGLKLVKLTQSAYDSLTTKDDNTVYFIGDSTNGYTMKIGSANVN